MPRFLWQGCDQSSGSVEVICWILLVAIGSLFDVCCRGTGKLWLFVGFVMADGLDSAMILCKRPELWIVIGSSSQPNPLTDGLSARQT
jgi:hypothetical protein